MRSDGGGTIHYKKEKEDLSYSGCVSIEKKRKRKGNPFIVRWTHVFLKEEGKKLIMSAPTQLINSHVTSL